MSPIILTSCLDLYEKDENGSRIPHHFGNFNNILNCLKNNIKKYDNFLFVASGNLDEITDIYYNATCESFKQTLPFKNYNILNFATSNKAKELVKNADLIFLCGGHLPSQNSFFNQINLQEIIKEANGLIVGGSAGSMNCANVVYCPPELEGESLDPNFKRYLNGLNLTNINILPHLNKFNAFVLDGKQYINDIILPDSKNTPIIALNDGSYILIKNNTSQVFGDAYLIKNKIITQICTTNNSINLEEINGQVK